MSADRNKPVEVPESFTVEEFILIMKRFSNLKRREKVGLIEAVEGIAPESVSDFISDIENILVR